jgi:hypothetical protein
LNEIVEIWLTILGSALMNVSSTRTEPSTPVPHHYFAHFCLC